MTEPLCDSCGEWTDPATLQDGDCPGCVAVRPDKAEQALAKLEQQWRTPGEPRLPDTPSGYIDDRLVQAHLDSDQPPNPEYLRERGFVEPEI